MPANQRHQTRRSDVSPGFLFPGMTGNGRLASSGSAAKSINFVTFSTT